MINALPPWLRLKLAIIVSHQDRQPENRNLFGVQLQRITEHSITQVGAPRNPENDVAYSGTVEAPYS